VEPRKIAKLQELGLTEYEARAYLALLEVTHAETQGAIAGRVAEVSRVPRTKIYDTLQSLARKGLLDMVPERPMRYVPRPLSEFLSAREDEMRKRLTTLEEEREALAAEFLPNGGLAVEGDGQFTLLRSRAAVEERVAAMMGRARIDVLLAATEGQVRRLAASPEAANEAARNGVAVRILAPLTERNRAAARALSEIAELRPMRWEENPGVAALIVDGEEAMLLHVLPDDDHLYVGSDVGLWTNDKAMVAGIRAMLELPWRLAHGLAAQRVASATA